MSQPVVSYVVNKLGDYLLNEASLFLGVRDQVERLERELRAMLSFLKDADTKRKGGDERVKNWVREIRDVAYDVEDVIETYMAEVKAGRYGRPLTSTVCDPFRRYKIGKKIEVLNSRIRDIADRRTRYGIGNVNETGGEGSGFVDEHLQALRRLSPYQYDETSIVGLDEDKKIIVERLLDPDDQRRHVISIVGMGGLGKTTLAKKVYYSAEVKQHFEVRAWVSVSQDYNVTTLLKKVIKEAIGGNINVLNEMDEEELKRELFQSLHNRGRYLIVMDDVWRTEVWRRIQPGFPDINNGSRVIFTTRIKDVALSADPTFTPYEPRTLNKLESRILFLKKVYPYKDVHTFEEDLEDVGQKLVDKCGGLPLALVVLGGLLSMKERNFSVWSRVLRALDNLDWQSIDEGKQCIEILALSYEDLPHGLKACFLYIGSFPEDSLIRAARLIKLWTAEGFIHPRQGQSREEIAEGFLEELAQRCMIQVADRKSSDHVRTFRVHDLIRDLCIEEARENGVLSIGSRDEDYLLATSTLVSTRRLAFQEDTDRGYVDPSSGNLRTPNLRTLLGFNVRPRQRLNGLKLLRVIDIGTPIARQNEDIIVFPKEITSLVHLRYLKWSSSMRTTLKFQSSVRNLRNLQTLDVYPALSSNVNGLGSLRNLEVLKGVNAGKWIARDLAKLKNLQKLKILELRDSHGQSFGDAVRELHQLISLSLSSDSSGVLPMTAFAVLPSLQHLRVLKLDGKISRLPDFPLSLTKLNLRRSELQEDPMAMLEKLSHIEVLRLENNACKSMSMSCSAGGFPRLKYLKLEQLEELEEWRVEVEAIPSLNHLIISWCPSLKMVPEGLQHLSKLVELQFIHMPQGFRDRVKKDDGEDWCKIRHVPSVVIRTGFESGMDVTICKCSSPVFLSMVYLPLPGCI